MYNLRENIIRRLREREGLTQRKLAQMLGVTAPVVSGWERVADIPTEKYIPQLCTIFNVDEKEIISHFRTCERENCRKKVYREELCLFHFNQEHKKPIPINDYITDKLQRVDTIGERLVILKNENGFTDEYIEKELGVTKCTIHAWEKNQISPTLLMIIDIASLYNVNTRLLERGNPNAGVVDGDE